MFFGYNLRYHKYSRNRYLDTTFRELYENDANMETVLFPKNVAIGLKNIKLSAEKYIYEHSAMPYYQLFLRKDTFDLVCNEMLYSKNSYIFKLKEQQGRRTHIKSNRLFYCPVCMKNHPNLCTLKTFHQIRGVYVCPEHHCYLNSIPLRPYKVLLDIEAWDYTVRYCEADSLLVGIAQDVEYIIANPPRFSVEILRENLLDAAWIKGVFSAGNWREEKYSEWAAVYQRLPVEYSKFASRASFKALAAKIPVQTLEPTEYLLFIRSLFGSFKNFYEDFVYTS